MENGGTPQCKTAVVRIEPERGWHASLTRKAKRGMAFRGICWGATIGNGDPAP